jgi:hypothetical protein
MVGKNVLRVVLIIVDCKCGNFEYQLDHAIMKVPFGKLAFMPGKLIHTNEILVLLGDNWFVERSAKQSSEIIDRRLDGIEKHLEKLNGEIKMFTDQLNWTNGLIKVIIRDCSITTTCKMKKLF